MIDNPRSYTGWPIPYGLSFEELCAQLSPPGPQAWAACIALGSCRDLKSIQVLAGLTESEDWRYRRISIEAIALHPDACSVADRVIAALGDSSPYVVRTACQTAATLGLREAHEKVIALLRDTAPYTRIVAVEALRSLWQPADFDAVFNLYLHDLQQDVRKAAAWILLDNVSRENWRILFLHWVSDPLPRHRVWACRLVVRFGEPADIELLEPLTRDRDGHVRKAVSRIINARAAHDAGEDSAVDQFDDG